MKLYTTSIADLVIIEPTVFEDTRGYFFESYHAQKLRELGIDLHWIQDNQSYSKQGTLRGLHYQLAPYAQAKLVRVLEGEIWDVAVDLRKGSPTFGKWEGIKLSAANKQQLFIPKGFAHGFCVLSETVLLSYLCTEVYHAEYDAVLAWDDPDIDIDWPVDSGRLSPKDASAPRLRDITPEALPRYVT